MVGYTQNEGYYMDYADSSSYYYDQNSISQYLGNGVQNMNLDYGMKRDNAVDSHLYSAPFGPRQTYQPVLPI